MSGCLGPRHPLVFGIEMSGTVEMIAGLPSLSQSSWSTRHSSCQSMYAIGPSNRIGSQT